MNSKDFFLAEGSLTWWAIGASLIASNISATEALLSRAYSEVSSGNDKVIMLNPQVAGFIFFSTILLIKFKGL